MKTETLIKRAVIKLINKCKKNNKSMEFIINAVKIQFPSVDYNQYL